MFHAIGISFNRHYVLSNRLLIIADVFIIMLTWKVCSVDISLIFSCNCKNYCKNYNKILRKYLLCILKLYESSATYIIHKEKAIDKNSLYKKQNKSLLNESYTVIESARLHCEARIQTITYTTSGLDYRRLYYVI